MQGIILTITTSSPTISNSSTLLTSSSTPAPSPKKAYFHHVLREFNKREPTPSPNAASISEKAGFYMERKQGTSRSSLSPSPPLPISPPHIYRRLFPPSTVRNSIIPIPFPPLPLPPLTPPLASTPSHQPSTLSATPATKHST